MIGQRKGSFELVTYQNEWVDLFNQEAELLKSVLGDNALMVVHVGSTSIPGMPAKAIIDIMVAVPTLTRSFEIIFKLDSIGYTYKPFDTNPDRLYFGKDIQTEIRTHNLHLALKGSKFWNDELMFRDNLRLNKELASEYIQVKKSFAEYYARTNHVDVEWKSAFVARVLEMAKEEL